MKNILLKKKDIIQFINTIKKQRKAEEVFQIKRD